MQTVSKEYLKAIGARRNVKERLEYAKERLWKHGCTEEYDKNMKALSYLISKITHSNPLEGSSLVTIILKMIFFNKI